MHRSKRTRKRGYEAKDVFIKPEVLPGYKQGSTTSSSTTTRTTHPARRRVALPDYVPGECVSLTESGQTAVYSSGKRNESPQQCDTNTVTYYPTRSHVNRGKVHGDSDTSTGTAINRQHDHRAAKATVHQHHSPSGARTRSGILCKARKRTPTARMALPNGVYLRQDVQLLDDDSVVMHSQATRPSEIGWDCNSPTTAAGESGGDIGDILRLVTTEKDKEESSVPGTPPNWEAFIPSPIETAESTKVNDEAPLRRGSRRSRRGQQSQQDVVETQQLLHRLVAVMERCPEEESTEQEVTETPVRRMRRSVRLSQRPPEDNIEPRQSTKTGISTTQNQTFAPVDQSFDLFDATQKKSPVVEVAFSKIRELRGVRRSPMHSLSHFKANMAPGKKSPLAAPERNLNISSDDLWTDEELFDDSFLKATQDLVDAVKTPKDMKWRLSVGTSEGTTPKGAGRYTFSLDSDDPTAVGALATVTNIVQSNVAASSGEKCEASACRRSKAKYSGRSLSTGNAAETPPFANSAITVSTQSGPMGRSGPATCSTLLGSSASRDSVLSANDNTRRRSGGQLQSGLLRPAKALPLQTYSVLPKQDHISPWPQVQSRPVAASTAGATELTFQKRRRISSSASSAATPQSCPSCLPVKVTATDPTQLPQRSTPTAAQAGSVKTNPMTVSKLCSSYSTKQNYRPDFVPPKSAVKNSSEVKTKSSEGDEKMKNTSISDDLLATLVEPDDLLDSQVCIESSVVSSKRAVGNAICAAPTSPISSKPQKAKPVNGALTRNTSNGRKCGQDQKCGTDSDEREEDAILALLAEVDATQEKLSAVTSTDGAGIPASVLGKQRKLEATAAPVCLPLNHSSPSTQTAVSSTSQNATVTKPATLPACDTVLVNTVESSAKCIGNDGSMAQKNCSAVALSTSTPIGIAPTVSTAVVGPVISAVNSGPASSRVGGGTLRKHRSSGCIMTPAAHNQHTGKDEGESENGASQSMSNSQGSKPRCSAEEIEKKRQEAVRKRQSKLKLGKKPKV